MRERELGTGHRQTVDARVDEETARRFARHPEEDPKALAASYADNERGVQLISTGHGGFLAGKW